MTAVPLKKRGLETEEDPREDEDRDHQGLSANHEKPSEGAGPANTLISRFCPPELWGNKKQKAEKQNYILK